MNGASYNTAATDKQKKKIYAVLKEKGIDPEEFREQRGISFSQLTKSRASEIIDELEQIGEEKIQDAKTDEVPEFRPLSEIEKERAQKHKEEKGEEEDLGIGDGYVELREEDYVVADMSDIVADMEESVKQAVRIIKEHVISTDLQIMGVGNLLEKIAMGIFMEIQRRREKEKEKEMEERKIRER